MQLIIPMAGKGTRMRPHTLTTPKPLISIIGKPIVAHLIKRIIAVCPIKINTIGFVIHPSFGKTVEKELGLLAKSVNKKSKIYYQNTPLGTAHAIFCAQELLHDKVIVAFADTIFESNQMFDISLESIIGVKKIKDPTSFGIVETNKENKIQKFVEKPKKFISDLAIIGVYYFKQAQHLFKAIEYLIHKEIQKNGEYQLTDALKNMQKSIQFTAQHMDDWLDFGCVTATLEAHKKILQKKNNLIQSNDNNNHTKFIPPVWCGKNVHIKNAVIGPYVSLGDNTVVNKGKISNSILQASNHVEDAVIENSFLGEFVKVSGGKLCHSSVGAYSTIIYQN